MPLLRDRAVERNRLSMAKNVIIVMGVQRSGTTALFQSLSTDKRVTALDESIESVVYYKYRLRPLAEIAHVLEAAPHVVLLKPLSETFYRTLESIAEEYAAFALRVVWIYRDPVNVLYSMHRQGWLPLAEIDSAVHLERWDRRNRLALQFQRSRPEQIAILRYEDCLADPQLFRRLANSLGLKGRSFFRADSASGRNNVPAAAQQKIDAFTSATRDALDKARTFKPRLIYRIAQSVARTMAPLRKAKRRRSAENVGASTLSVKTHPGAPETELSPSSVDGLRFWLAAPANTRTAGETLSVWRDRGPHQMTAPNVVNGPFQIPCMNGEEAIAFAPEIVAERREGSSGILTFGRGLDWAFLLDGRPFSMVAFYKPDVPNYAPYRQERAVLLRIGATDKIGPALILEWDGKLNASKAILVVHQHSPGIQSADAEIVATSPPGSHRHQEWRVVQVQHSTEGGLSISVNGLAGKQTSVVRQQPRAAGELELRLGGSGIDLESLFYGAVAEIAIFDRTLDATEQRGITHYLNRKYHL